MIRQVSRNALRQRIHQRFRKKLRGSAQRPRLCIFRSNQHIYAQVIDDQGGRTLAAAASNEKESPAKASGGNVAGARQVGKVLADRARQAGISTVVFDRGGYLYHGRVKALAEAAREAGLQF